MFPKASVIRDGERSLAWGAFALLFLLMMSHALLETARDALFLSSIPAERLPLVYIMVAAAALAVLRFQKSVQHRIPARMALPVYLTGAAVLTGALWIALPSLGDPGLYLLYVWSGVLITLVLVEFWLVLGATVTVQQAKRLFAFVGTGSVAGAIVGFAFAGALASNFGTDVLLPAAVVGLLIAAILSPWLAKGATAEAVPKQTDDPMQMSKLLSMPYVRKVALLVLVSTITVTVADYVFKSTIAESVPPSELGMWFASIYLVLNVLALAVQLALTSRIVRFLGVTRSATVLPAALSLGALGTLFGFGLPAAIALKGADGTLRHTLGQTSKELLFVPLSSRVRNRVKGMIDVVGQRGGQALASIGILGYVAVEFDPKVLGLVVLVLAAVWIALAVHLRKPYLAVFRRTLDQLATGRRLDFPELDVASLESLIAALNSPNDGKVLAALDILEDQDKTHLVPVLLLYHPSTPVVTTTLEVFVRAGRTDFVPVAEQLQGNANPTVHAAVVRARAAIEPDETYLRAMRQSPCRATRTTAAVYLHAMGATSRAEAEASFEELRNHDNRVTAELAIARAAPHADSALAREVLTELIISSNDDVAHAAIASMGEIGAAELLPALVAQLEDRALRNEVLDVLPRFGVDGVKYLDDALESDAPAAVKREIPRALGRFAPIDAVPVFLRRVGDRDGMVKFRVIRELERLMAATPELASSPQGWGPGSRGRAALATELENTLRRVYTFIDQRAVLREGVAEDPTRATDEHQFLMRLLRDKQRHAEERLVRLIGLSHPDEDFGGIWRGLQSTGRVRASSQELLDHMLVAPLRGPITVLFDDGTDPERLAAAGEYYTPVPRSYNAVIGMLVESDSASLSALAVALVGAQRLTDLQPKLQALPARTPMLSDVIERALRALRDPLAGATS